MLHTKFQVSKPSGSEVDDFSMYFYGLNLSPHSVGPCWIQDLHLNKLGKVLLGNATY